MPLQLPFHTQPSGSCWARPLPHLPCSGSRGTNLCCCSSRSPLWSLRPTTSAGVPCCAQFLWPVQCWPGLGRHSLCAQADQYGSKLVSASLDGSTLPSPPQLLKYRSVHGTDHTWDSEGPLGEDGDPTSLSPALTKAGADPWGCSPGSWWWSSHSQAPSAVPDLGFPQGLVHRPPAVSSDALGRTPHSRSLPALRWYFWDALSSTAASSEGMRNLRNSWPVFVVAGKDPRDPPTVTLALCPRL